MAFFFMLFLEISEHKFLNKDLRTHCEIPSENVTFLHYSEQKVKKHKVKSKKWYNKMKQINHNDIHVDRVVTNENKTNIGGGGWSERALVNMTSLEYHLMKISLCLTKLQ